MEVIQVKPCKWLRVELFRAVTGHTSNTIAKCKQRGIWTEGIHYKLAPEGKRSYYYNVEAIQQLIERA